MLVAFWLLLTFFQDIPKLFGNKTVVYKTSTTFLYRFDICVLSVLISIKNKL